ncbi:hypothetical protein EBZ39_06625 [bacterium]|nr:hypothetical protein [bacterium]
MQRRLFLLMLCLSALSANASAAARRALAAGSLLGCAYAGHHFISKPLFEHKPESSPSVSRSHVGKRTHPRQDSLDRRIAVALETNRYFNAQTGVLAVLTGLASETKTGSFRANLHQYFARLETDTPHPRRAATTWCTAFMVANLDASALESVAYTSSSELNTKAASIIDEILARNPELDIPTLTVIARGYIEYSLWPCSREPFTREDIAVALIARSRKEACIQQRQFEEEFETHWTLLETTLH